MLLSVNSKNEVPLSVFVNEKTNGTMGQLFVQNCLTFIKAKRNFWSNFELMELFTKKINDCGNILHVLCDNSQLLGNSLDILLNKVVIKDASSFVQTNFNTALSLAAKAEFNESKPIDLLEMNVNTDIFDSENEENVNNWINALSRLS